MDFSELTLRLMLIFFPGIVCHLIVDPLTVHKDRQPFQVLLFAFVYGVLSYLIYAAILYGGFYVSSSFLAATGGIKVPVDGSSAFQNPQVAFANFLLDPKRPLNLTEIICATTIAIVLAFAITALHYQKSLFDFAHAIGATGKFGDPNVWSFAMNSKELRWVVVRDLQKDLMFQGYIRAFSDIDEKVAELLLVSVHVFRESTGQKLYETDTMYLARKPDDITIEFPAFDESSAAMGN